MILLYRLNSSHNMLSIHIFDIFFSYFANCLVCTLSILTSMSNYLPVFKGCLYFNLFSIFLSPFVSLSLCLFLSVCFSLCLSLSLSFTLSLCLSVSLYSYLYFLTSACKDIYFSEKWYSTCYWLVHKTICIQHWQLQLNQEII